MYKNKTRRKYEWILNWFLEAQEFKTKVIKESRKERSKSNKKFRISIYPYTTSIKGKPEDVNDICSTYDVGLLSGVCMCVNA